MPSPQTLSPPTTSPLPCPSCRVPLPPAAQICPSCGLTLTGSAAAQLWRTDQQLLALQRRRRELISWLHQHPPAPLATVPVAATGPQRSWTGQQLLLAAGALLVLTAGTVFLAVTWATIGVGGQVAVMAVLTAAAGGASLHVSRGRLTATAETLAAIAVGLGAVDLAAARRLDLAGLGSVDRSWYATAAATLLAVACVAMSRAARSLVCFPLAGALAGAVVPLLVLVAADASRLVTVLTFSGAAAAAGLAARWLHSGRAARAVLLVTACCYLAAGWLVAVVTELDRPFVGAGGLAGLVSLAACVGAGWWSGAGRRRSSTAGGTALLTAAVLAAVATTSAGVWSADRSAVATAVLASVAAGAAALLPVLAARHARTAVLALHLLTVLSLLLAGGRYLEALDPQRSPLGWTLTTALSATAVAAGLAARRPGPHRWPAAGYAALLVLSAGTVAALPSGAAWTIGVLSAISVVAAGLAGSRRTGPAEVLGSTTWLVATLAALAAAQSTAAPAVPTAAVLAVAGLTAAAYALLPGRGDLAVLASLLCSGAIWTVLVDRGVSTVEAYTLPLAVLLGVVGLVRLRRDPAASSWLTVGPLLAVGLLPSAVVSTDDPALLRPLLVLGVGAAVLLLGMARRWQAPLVVGALALVVVAVSQLAPWAVGLPRWLSFGSIGLLLLVLGARYEQRRRDARSALAWVVALH